MALSPLLTKIYSPLIKTHSRGEKVTPITIRRPRVDRVIEPTQQTSSRPQPVSSSPPPPPPPPTIPPPTMYDPYSPGSEGWLFLDIISRYPPPPVLDQYPVYQQPVIDAPVTTPPPSLYQQLPPVFGFLYQPTPPPITTPITRLPVIESKPVEPIREEEKKKQPTIYISYPGEAEGPTGGGVY